MLRSDFFIKAIWTACLISWIHSPDFYCHSWLVAPRFSRLPEPTSSKMVESMEVTLDSDRNPVTAEIKFAALGQ